MHYVFYPITGVDLAPYVTKAVAYKPNFVLTLGGGAVAIQLFQSLEQAGIPADEIMGSANAPAYQSVLKPAGSVMNGGYFSSEVQNWNDLSNPGVGIYLKAMGQYESGVDPQDPNPETAWADVMLLWQASKQIGATKFSAATFAKWTQTANKVPLPLSRTYLNPGPKGSTSIKQPFTEIVQWKNGKLNIVKSGTNAGWVRGY